MIQKSIQYRETENVVLAEFGNGTIVMYIGRFTPEQCTNKCGLAFKSANTPHPINVELPHGFKSFDELKPEIVFTFTNTKSIDSLIRQLNICKELLK